MTKLDTRSRFPDPDAAFRLLIEAHRGRTPEDGARLNAKLVLLLANHVGDIEVLRDAVRVAQEADARPGTAA